MHLLNLDLNFSSFPSHITTLYRGGGGEIVYRDKKHGVPKVLAAIVGKLKSLCTLDISFFTQAHHLYCLTGVGSLSM